MKERDFVGKVAIVSGAASGIGRLTAYKLAEGGASVLLADVDEAGLAEAEREIGATGATVGSAVVDVRDYGQIVKAVETASDRYGRIDILINCAGGSAGRVHGSPKPFHKQEIGIIEWGIDVNFRGPLYFSHAIFPAMIKNNYGVIINLGSITGLTGGGDAEYSAAKSGLIGLTKSLAILGAPHGIRCCCVTPGPVLTRPAMAKMKTLLGRAAAPVEVVDLILYLASDKAAFITGSDHVIDGGRNCLAALT